MPSPSLYLYIEWIAEGLSISMCYQPSIHAWTLKSHGAITNDKDTKIFNANLYVKTDIDHLVHDTATLLRDQSRSTNHCSIFCCINAIW
jgi:hypothetical protein